VEFLARLRPKDGSTAGLATALDPFFNPEAARARQEIERQHELVMPTPSPGDRLLDGGVAVIELPDTRSEPSTGAGLVKAPESVNVDSCSHRTPS
jgi:hypothetical protein